MTLAGRFSTVFTYHKRAFFRVEYHDWYRRHWLWTLGTKSCAVFGGLPDCRLVGVSDSDERRLQAAQQAVPGGVLTSDFRILPRHPDIQAVIVSTPLTTHYAIVKEALLADKDVLVEKPICHATAEANELIELAEARGRILMCGHIFLFNAGIRKLRDYIREGTLGRIYYMSATRTNLGPLRRDANALYDLGSHDVSIFHYLLDDPPDRGGRLGRVLPAARRRGRGLRHARILAQTRCATCTSAG